MDYYYSKTDWLLILILCAITFGEAATFLFFALMRTSCGIPISPGFVIGEVAILLLAIVVGFFAFLGQSTAR